MLHHTPLIATIVIGLVLAFVFGRRAINPNLPIIARAHSDAEVDHLQKLGAGVTIMGEHEIARSMIEYAV